MRILELSTAFNASCALLAPGGSTVRRAVMRVLHELEDDGSPLPGPQDHDVVIAPDLRCIWRPIPSAGLLLCFSVHEHIVKLRGVMPMS